MRTILLVEDDFHIQDIYRMAFVKTGNYSIETASDGQEALVKLRAHVYDLILLDIMLPKVTGIDVLRAMRAPGSPTQDTPIILITNLGQEDIIKEAFKIGADGYLIKAQFTPQDVVTEVDAFFKQMEQLNQAAPPPQNAQLATAVNQTQNSPASIKSEPVTQTTATPPSTPSSADKNPQPSTPAPTPETAEGKPINTDTNNPAPDNSTTASLNQPQSPAGQENSIDQTKSTSSEPAAKIVPVAPTPPVNGASSTDSGGNN